MASIVGSIVASTDSLPIAADGSCVSHCEKLVEAGTKRIVGVVPSLEGLAFDNPVRVAPEAHSTSGQGVSVCACPKILSRFLPSAALFWGRISLMRVSLITMRTRTEAGR